MRGAVEKLRELPETDVVALSTFRNTDPIGFLDQPQFLNGVVELETGLSARALRIEQRLSRPFQFAIPENILGRREPVSQTIDRLETGLGKSDRGKLTEYLEAIRDIERRIQKAEEQNATMKIPVF